MTAGQPADDDNPAADEFSGIRNPLHYFWPGLTDEESQTIDNETFVIQERRAKVAKLYAKGYSYRRMVEEVGCSKTTIGRDVLEVHKHWQRVAVRSMGEQIAMALMRLATLEQDYEEQWERSKGDYTETVSGQRGAGKSASQHATIRKRQKYGDPKLAKLLLECWDRRCKLLGLLKVELGGDSMLPPVKYVAGLDPVEVA